MKEMKIKQVQEIRDAEILRWELTLVNGDTKTISVFDCLGNNAPEIDGKMINCADICKNRDGLCIKQNKKFNIPCKQQFVYFRGSRTR